MLIDEQGMFLTQRIYPAMALFKTAEPAPGHYHVTYEGDEVELPVTNSGTTVRAQIWDDVVEVVEAAPELSQWFSLRLNFRCRLVGFPEDNRRAVDKKYAVGDDQVSLADAYPILVIGQSSLDDLNTRLAQAVPMNRFRPNIVFTGGRPYEEDHWRSFKVGSFRYAGVKTCARCVLTTVDQDSGVKGKEPLATLTAYRRVDNRVLFGMNVIPIDYGTINEGDEIAVG